MKIKALAVVLLAVTLTLTACKNSPSTSGSHVSDSSSSLTQKEKDQKEQKSDKTLAADEPGVKAEDLVLKLNPKLEESVFINKSDWDICFVEFRSSDIAFRPKTTGRIQPGATIELWNTEAVDASADEDGAHKAYDIEAISKNIDKITYTVFDGKNQISRVIYNPKTKEYKTVRNYVLDKPNTQDEYPLTFTENPPFSMNDIKYTQTTENGKVVAKITNNSSKSISNVKVTLQNIATGQLFFTEDNNLEVKGGQTLTVTFATPEQMSVKTALGLWMEDISYEYTDDDGRHYIIENDRGYGQLYMVTQTTMISE